MRKVEDIDEIIQASQTKNGKLNKSVLLDPTAVVFETLSVAFQTFQKSRSCKRLCLGSLKNGAHLRTQFAIS